MPNPCALWLRRFTKRPALWGTINDAPARFTFDTTSAVTMISADAWGRAQPREGSSVDPSHYWTLRQQLDCCEDWYAYEWATVNVLNSRFETQAFIVGDMGPIDISLGWNAIYEQGIQIDGWTLSARMLDMPGTGEENFGAKWRGRCHLHHADACPATLRHQELAPATLAGSGTGSAPSLQQQHLYQGSHPPTGRSSAGPNTEPADEPRTRSAPNATQYITGRQRQPAGDKTDGEDRQASRGELSKHGAAASITPQTPPVWVCANTKFNPFFKPIAGTPEKPQRGTPVGAEATAATPATAAASATTTTTTTTSGARDATRREDMLRDVTSGTSKILRERAQHGLEGSRLGGAQPTAPRTTPNSTTGQDHDDEDKGHDSDATESTSSSSGAERTGSKSGPRL